MTTNRHFFAQKQPWSTIKDQLLAAYLAPYLAKLSQQGGGVFSLPIVLPVGAPLMMGPRARRY
jgi:hypothetical protein